MEDKTQRRSALRALLALPLGLAGIAAVTTPAHAADKRKSETKEALDRLVSHQQIIDVLYLYARGWDRYDEDIIRACFWPDALHQHGGFKGKSQDFITGGMKAVKGVIGTSHMITNPLVVIEGDKAVSECHFLSHHRRPKKTGDGEEYWYLKGRYLDRFERREGAWKIAYRRGLHDYSQTLAPTDEFIAKAAPEQMSHRKPDDPLYELLAALKPGA